MKEFLKNIAGDLARSAASYKRTAFVLNMHALPTIADMLDVMSDAGVKRDNILFIAKPYSTIEKVRQKLAKNSIGFVQVAERFKSGDLIGRNHDLLTQELPPFIDRIRGCSLTLLDSGGHLTRRMDSYGIPVNSIQLTSSGSRVTNGRAGGIVDIGSLNLKKDAESKAIARAALSIVQRAVRDSDDKKICVVGKGAVGNALTSVLQTRKTEVQHVEGVRISEKIDCDCDIVIGATGYDLSGLLRNSLDPGRKVDLFSCSSWDIEYQTLLSEADQAISFISGDETAVVVRNANWIVHNAGCPINFDRNSELESPRHMAMTRGLTLAAALHPAAFRKNIAHVKKLYMMHY